MVVELIEGVLNIVPLPNEPPPDKVEYHLIVAEEVAVRATDHVPHLELPVVAGADGNEFITASTATRELAQLPFIAST